MMCRQIASAMGLRQVLPVHTKRIIRLASRCKVFSGTTPWRSSFIAIPRDANHRRRLAKAAGAVIQNQIDPAAQGVAHLFGGDGIGLARLVDAGQRQRPDQHPQHVKNHLMPRHAKPDRLPGGNDLLDLGGQPSQQALGLGDRRRPA